MNTRIQGLTGEDIAVSYLAKKGYTVIARNFRIRNGELDIVALDPQRKILVFVEVKTRSSNQFGTPFESITSWKLKFLIRAAQFYKISHKNLPDSMRIDAISVEFNPDGTEKIEHMENISGF